MSKYFSFMLSTVIVVILSSTPFAAAFDFEQLFSFTTKGEDKVDKILSKCYGNYGCFSVGGKFVSVFRPVNLFPYSPEMISTKLLLYTRRNPNRPLFLTPDDVSGINRTTFNFSTPTKFIVHGFLETGYHTWCMKMKDELLVYDDFNVITVDWLIGALPPYTQAVANARLVGAVIARFLQLLEAAYDYPPRMSHIIGHSLGAHIAGYAGQRLTKLGRISGLDPAGPYFENTDPVVRLDPSDALLVDVIHTDGASIINRAFGMRDAVGHLDFYPNGGVNQPGCEASVGEALEREDMDLYKGFRHWVACRHVRAHEYYTESINSQCAFIAFECQDYEAFSSGKCISCGREEHSCAKMGFHADEFATYKSSQPKKLFLKTNSNPPFCTTHYLITIRTTQRGKSLNDDALKGKLILEIIDDKHITEINDFGTSEKTFEPGKTYSIVTGSRIAGPLRRIRLYLSQTDTLTNQFFLKIFKGEPTLEIQSAEVENLETREIMEFCGGNKILKSDSKITLYPRPNCHIIS